MKRICLLSDSHGSRSKIEDLIFSNNFDYIFFMGDGLRDFENIDEDNLKKVSGNCDLFNFEAITQFLEIEGFKIMITHGHEYKAKLTTLLMLKKAKENYCNIVCYGHTHKQLCEEIDNIYLINPGSFKNNDYGILSLQKNKKPTIEFFKY
ncbi:MAG: YfcE family phosphodiesterase [Clostridia bacterium]|nr:YfcE family phosphodiesterase [Clostridia bacterium]